MTLWDIQLPVLPRNKPVVIRRHVDSRLLGVCLRVSHHHTPSTDRCRRRRLAGRAGSESPNAPSPSPVQSVLTAPRSRRTKRVRRALEIPPWPRQHSSAHPRGTIQTWKKLGKVQLRKIRENGKLSSPAPSSPRWPRFYICSVEFRVSRRLGCLQHPRSAKTDYTDVVADGCGLSHIPEPRSLSKAKCCIGPKLAADSRVVVTARSREPNAGLQHINQATFDTEGGDPATDEGLKMIWNADVLGDQGQTGKTKGVGGWAAGVAACFPLSSSFSQPSLNSTVVPWSLKKKFA
ncbi:uncharacterized protein CCOS01_08227 [Colletotrichum costaricense]|uniref:Uncharacterized protein n=1 Tax=Colletotrichum costaricense TaxID=1209916 RepID=A0AAI9YV05_9PEZI|nr:uncharacterized protein CCOS01_08227 [Colletotrichum costaricense]KAK1525809.1 hypothetical protein CCOS01_08227 [Colletotrichum costaricense]